MVRGIFKILRHQRSLAALLLTIFATYFINVTLFPHSHVVDGVTIVHSHFSSAEHRHDPLGENHTESQLTLISVLSQFIVEAQEYFEISQVNLLEFHTQFIVVAVTLSTSDTYALPSLRAPPVEIYIG